MRALAVLVALAPALAPLGEGRRPRDPFVFRCVLDGRPRSVVIALHEELWVAWDAASCGFVRAWHGDADLRGAVYDTVHGPQPAARGWTYAQTAAQPSFYALDAAGERVPLQPTWLGYRLVDDDVVLAYGAVLPSGSRVRIEEVPSFVRADDGRPALARALRVVGLRAGDALLARYELRAAELLADGVELAPDEEPEPPAEPADPDRAARGRRFAGWLPLAAEGLTRLVAIFPPAPAEEGEVEGGER